MLLPFLIVMAVTLPGLSPGDVVTKHYNKRTGGVYYTITNRDPEAPIPKVAEEDTARPDWHKRCRDSVRAVEMAMRSTKVHYSDGSTLNLQAIPCVGGNGQIFTGHK